MDRPANIAWGKLSRDQTGAVNGWHSLVDHSADVAACFEALITIPTISSRLARLADMDSLPAIWISRLATCAFLHDLGKANAGFQARWNNEAPFVGHMQPALVLLTRLLDLANRALPLA